MIRALITGGVTAAWIGLLFVGDWLTIGYGVVGALLMGLVCWELAAWRAGGR